VVFVGPSGCGKSTLLRTLAGLEGASSGRIEIDGRDVTETEPADRDLSMVFQSYALYPHMSVRANMEFGMKVNGFEPALQKERIAEAFDEPLSNLDAKLRVQMRVELEALHKQLGATMIYVTHDQVEAMTMADKIVVLNEGRVEQVGTPLELYHQPNSRFVAEFIGSPAMNVFSVEAGLQGLALDPKAAMVGCRPEHFEVVGAGQGHADATVHVKEELGGESLLYLKVKGGGEVVARVHGDDVTEVGAEIALRIPENRLYQFDASGWAI